MSTQPLMSSGGRMLRRPTRRTTGTPYSRPPATVAAPVPAVSGGLLSKLVDFGASLISHVSFWRRPNSGDKELNKVHVSRDDSTLAMVTKVEEPAVSPCELAKSYMGTIATRPLHISPTRLGLRGVLMRGDPPSPNEYQFPLRPSNMFPASKSTTPILTRMQQRSRIGARSPYARLSSPVLSKSLHTGRQSGSYMSARPLRTLGRSAIYRVACHPYARLPLPVVSKSLHVNYGGYTGQATSLHQTRVIDRQTLKRKSLARDDNVVYWGSIRRIRQKTNLLSLSKDMHTSAFRNALPNPLVPVRSHVETKENCGSGNHIASGTSVPPQSSAMAQKILSELETIASSPKAESSEIKLAMAGREEEDSSNPETVPCKDKNINVPAGGNSLSESQLSLSQTNSKIEDNNKLEIDPDEDQRLVKSAFRMSVSKDSMDDDDDDETILGMAQEEDDSSNLETVPCNDGNINVPASGSHLSETQLSLSQTNRMEEENGKLEINLDEDQRHVKPAFRMSVSEDFVEDDDQTSETISSRAHVFSIDCRGTEKSQISEFSSTNNISSIFQLKCSAGFDFKPFMLFSDTNPFETQPQNTYLDEKGENEKEVDPRPAISPLILSRGFGSSSQLASSTSLLGSSSSICS